MTRRTARVQDVVVGSGAGGGVLAARLAEAGRAVLLLEEGPKVSRHDFNQREGDMYALLYRDAGGQATADGAVSVMQGRCLGGSTTINMGDVVPTPPEVLAHWRTRFGWGDWGGISDGDVNAASDRAIADLGAGPIAEADINRNNRLLRSGAERLGIAGHALHHNRTGCVGSGYCLIGCAYDAKRGTLVAHIPRALAAGAQLWCDARVDRIERGSGGARVLGADFEVSAERVLVCAGTIHTPGILARSGLGGPALGRHLSLQPQGPVLALFADDVVLHRGIPQSWAVDGRLQATAEGGLGGFAIEGVAGGPAMTASMMPLPMRDLRPLLARYRQAAAALCLVPDRPTGRVRSDGARPVIEYAPSAEYRGRLRDALSTAARIYLAAGAQEVWLPLVGARPMRSEADVGAIADLPLRSCDLAMISAHPQGSCRMGPRPEDSVVGMDFGVHGAGGMFVCDASLFPTSASTHTMIPTMAMAHLLADQLA